MSGAPHEIELKLRLPRASVPALLRHPVLRVLKRGRARTETLAGTYFDTPDWRLARDGIALRIRRAGRRLVQTVKGPATGVAGGGLSARPEYEWPLPSGAAAAALDLAALGTVPFGKRLLKAAGRDGFGARFTTEVRRTTIPLAFPDSTMALLCVDLGEVRGPPPKRARSAISEVEIELEAGSPERLFELALALVDDLPLTVEARSKAERGHAIATGARPQPVVADDVRLPEGIDAAGAIAAIVGSCLRQIEANADGLIADDDPEWVHQMRVGLRRLRSCLALARRHVPPSAMGHLEDDLRWLASALGPARDLDVFALETLPAMRDASRHAAGGATAMAPLLDELDARASARRRAARAEAREAVLSKRFQRLLLAGGLFAATPRLAAVEGSTEAAALAEPATVFAAKLLSRRHRKLARRIPGLAEMPPGERHRVRILAKRLRYATEFFSPLFPGRRTRTYRKALADMQGILGRLNDAAVAAVLAAELGDPASPAAAMFAGWAAAQGEGAVPALDRARRAYADASPFWK